MVENSDVTPHGGARGANTPSNLRDLSHDELAAMLTELGAPAFRVKQVEGWLGRPEVTSFEAMTNLPKALREELAARYTLASVELAATRVSKDGSRKYLVRCADGVMVECVGLPSSGRLSVCVSAQAGCAMGCAFCATGRSGLTRSLSAREIADQVAVVRGDFGLRVSSVVFMGQGEPFANYDATLAALRILNAPGPETIGARHLTVSTCGVIPRIRQFSKEPEQFTLAISLHSAVQQTRNALMPATRKYPLTRLHEVLEEYAERTHRRPTYEFAPIDGVNDTNSEVEALVDFCVGTLCHVNLIHLNALEGSPLAPSPDAKVRSIRARLERAGIEATIREPRGQDIEAACGQLRQRLEGVGF